jgi:hypothetical protein
MFTRLKIFTALGLVVGLLWKHNETNKQENTNQLDQVCFLGKKCCLVASVRVCFCVTFYTFFFFILIVDGARVLSTVGIADIPSPTED